MIRPVVLEAVDVSYRRAGGTSIRRVSLAAFRGELLALCGPPGAGTSALLELLGGARQPDAGRVHRRGVPPVLTRGHESAAAALAHAHERSVLLLDHVGTSERDERDVLTRARRAADAGATVVVTTHDLALVAEHAHTAALLVAGRLVAWAEPARAFVPAVRLLGYSSTPCASMARGS